MYWMGWNRTYGKNQSANWRARNDSDTFAPLCAKTTTTTTMENTKNAWANSVSHRLIYIFTHSMRAVFRTLFAFLFIAAAAFLDSVIRFALNENIARWLKSRAKEMQTNLILNFILCVTIFVLFFSASSIYCFQLVWSRHKTARSRVT